jgi:hypothetical protein
VRLPVVHQEVASALWWLYWRSALVVMCTRQGCGWESTWNGRLGAATNICMDNRADEWNCGEPPLSIAGVSTEVHIDGAWLVGV